MKKALGKVGIYTSEKVVPQNFDIATDIALMSISVVKLLVLPVWGTVFTSGLYLKLFSNVVRCRSKTRRNYVSTSSCPVA